MRKKILFFFLAIELFAFGGNTRINKFETSKKILFEIYNSLPKTTLYCGATFLAGDIIDSNGFYSEKFLNRASIVEWEHIVPAENFGREFDSWRNGNEECKKNGELFKGRPCAEKISNSYNLMQADMYNVYPSIGSVNALRSNYNFVAYLEVQEGLKDCKMFISDRKVVPPDRAKGIIARTYMYMDSVYPEYKMSSQNKKLFNAWDKQFPVTSVECKRARLIQEKQGNINNILSKRCRESNFW